MAILLNLLVKNLLRDPRGRGTGSVCDLSEFKRTLENLAKEYCNYTFVVPKRILFELNLYKNNARN